MDCLQRAGQELRSPTRRSPKSATPIYVRPAIIAVNNGNPKHVRSVEDLLKDDMKIVVTEGAGVANTSGTGTWQDVANREGRLADIARFRKDIAGQVHSAALRLKLC